jgi:hypothetical protein
MCETILLYRHKHVHDNNNNNDHYRNAYTHLFLYRIGQMINCNKSTKGCFAFSPEKILEHAVFFHARDAPPPPGLPHVYLVLQTLHLLHRLRWEPRLFHRALGSLVIPGEAVTPKQGYFTNTICLAMFMISICNTISL